MKPELGATLERLPRLELAQLPTPLHRLPRLSEELDIELWIKRDDCTGLALGGNKARKLEFLLGGAVAGGCDTVVTTGGSQSNHARLTAAACRVAGLDCRLVLDRGLHPENGNLLLDRLFGARVEFVADQEPETAVAAMEQLRQRLEQEGRKVYMIPRGGSVPTGASGYAAMTLELERQLSSLDLSDVSLYLATGSCGTHSGVMAGRAALGVSWRVQGISVSRPAAQQEDRVLQLSNETLTHLDLDSATIASDVHVDDNFVGGGYGHPDNRTWEAIRLLARSEGILLDPVYSGKAMAGLLAHVREGVVPARSTVVFLHTGGSPALFAYASEVEEMA